MKNPRKSTTALLALVAVIALGACSPLAGPPVRDLSKPPACKSVPMPVGSGWTFTREPGAAYGTVASRSGVVAGFSRTEDADVAWLSTRCVLESPSNG